MSGSLGFRHSSDSEEGNLHTLEHANNGHKDKEENERSGRRNASPPAARPENKSVSNSITE
jgi:hypothetical protein